MLPPLEKKRGDLPVRNMTLEIFSSAIYFKGTVFNGAKEGNNENVNKDVYLLKNL